MRAAPSAAAPVADIARFADLSGWRKGEILLLRWEAVFWTVRDGERAPSEVRLKTSSNGRPRSLPLERELLAL